VPATRLLNASGHVIHLDDKQKERLLAAWNAGVNVKDLVRRFNVNQLTISNIIIAFRREGRTVVPRRGREV